MSEGAETQDQEPKQKIHLGGRYWRLWSASVISNLGDGVAQIAYPWLASAVTRNGVLIALIAVAQRLPWLVFTLPAGVITDRVDRRKIMVAMDTVRTAVTLLVAAATNFVRYDDVSADAIQRVANYLGQVESKKYDQLMAASVQDHQQYLPLKQKY